MMEEKQDKKITLHLQSIFCRCKVVFLSFFSATVLQQGSLIAFFHLFLVSSLFSAPSLLEMKFCRNLLSLVIFKTHHSWLLQKSVEQLVQCIHTSFCQVKYFPSQLTREVCILLTLKVRHSNFCLIKIIKLWNLKCCLKSYPNRMKCNLNNIIDERKRVAKQMQLYSTVLACSNTSATS